jgi:hypothetical protein
MITTKSHTDPSADSFSFLSGDHISGYAQRDWHVVDYQMYELESTKLLFRGPKPFNLHQQPYLACMGAAQTLGCLCERPFPTLLGEMLGLPTLNLGYGGAGPAFFNRRPEVLRYANNAALVTVQVMSGRSESNSLYSSAGLELLHRRSDGSTIGADAAYRKLLREHALFGIRLTSKREYFFFPSRPLGIDAVIEETRANWILSYRTLLEKITVPKILFYFSKRKPEYSPRYYSVNSLFGAFPQLVNQSMLDVLRPLADGWVECVSRRGSPQRLHSRFTGRPVAINLSHDRPDFHGTWRKNSYYPSPEMHEDAANALLPACLHVLRRK